MPGAPLHRGLGASPRSYRRGTGREAPGTARSARAPRGSPARRAMRRTAAGRTTRVRRGRSGDEGSSSSAAPGSSGRAIVRRLLTRGHDVAVLNRGEHAGRPARRTTSSTSAAIAIGSPSRAARCIASRPTSCSTTWSTTSATRRPLSRCSAGMAERLVLVSSMDVYRAYGRLNGTEPGPLEPMPQDEDRAPARAPATRTASTPRTRPILRWTYDKIPAEKAVLGDEDLPGHGAPPAHGARTRRLPAPPLPGSCGRWSTAVPASCCRTDTRTGSPPTRTWRTSARPSALACTHEAAAGRIYNVADGALSTLGAGRARGAHAGLGRRVRLLPRDELPEALVMPWRVEQSLVAQAERIREELGLRGARGSRGRRARDRALGARQPARSDPRGPAELRGPGPGARPAVGRRARSAVSARTSRSRGRGRVGRWAGADPAASAAAGASSDGARRAPRAGGHRGARHRGVAGGPARTATPSAEPSAGPGSPARPPSAAYRPGRAPGRPRDCGGRAGGPTVADGPARRTQDPTALEMSARGAALPEGRERSSSVGTFRTSRSSWTSHARTSRRGDGVARDPTRRAPRPSRTARPWRHRARPRSTPSRTDGP